MHSHFSVDVRINMGNHPGLAGDLDVESRHQLHDPLPWLGVVYWPFIIT